MSKEKWLPGDLRDRLQDLCKKRKISQNELAEAIGVDRSKLSRFTSGKTDTLTDEDVIRIARYFGVSTDFLLGETDDPGRINYDIGELGLTVQAAEKLYTRKVDPVILCQILENERCGELMQQIAVYQQGQLTSGIAAQNQMLNSLAGMLTRQATAFPEDKDAAKEVLPLLKNMQIPVYASETDRIMKNFGAIVHDMKEEAPKTERQAAAATKETMNQLYRGMQKGNPQMNLRWITPELFVNSLFSQLSVPDAPADLKEEMDDVMKRLKEDFTDYFGILQRAGEELH